MAKFFDWPERLQVLVLVPHGSLGFVATWLWWPKSKESFCIVDVMALSYVETSTGGAPRRTD